MCCKWDTCEGGRLWIHRRVGEETERNVFCQPFNLVGKLMVWGCFSVHGVGDLYLIHGKVNAMRYREILKHHMAKNTEQWAKMLFFSMITHLAILLKRLKIIYQEEGFEFDLGRVNRPI